MQRKDILELKKRFKKDKSTFTNLCGCYVNDEKQIVSKFSEFFPALEEDELFKYLEIANKVLSGTIGNNILELNFPLDDNFSNQGQTTLLDLRNSGLKDDAMLDDFYDRVIEHYDYEGNYLILMFHDAYDVMTRTKDNQSLDESEEVFQYVLCAICPVALSQPGLTYVEQEDKIKSRIRDWVVAPPVNGFMFPAFIDRSADVNAVMYYTKKPKDPHPELMEEILGCDPKQTATIKKETFESIIKDSLDVEEEQAELIFMDVQDSLNTMIHEYNTLYEDVEHDPITLSQNHIQDLLVETGLPEEASEKIEETYAMCFSDDLPLAEHLIDKKVLKASAQMQKERTLIKQIGALETKLEEVIQTSLLSHDDILDDETGPAIILRVKAEKVGDIRTQVIDGQKYMVIPLDDDDQVRINGEDDLIE